MEEELRVFFKSIVGEMNTFNDNVSKRIDRLEQKLGIHSDENDMVLFIKSSINSIENKALKDI